MTVPASAIAVPAMDIRLNGVPLPYDAQRDVQSVTVLEDLANLSMFSLVLYNWDADRRAVSWSDSSLFAIGTEVRIALGFVGATHEVMTGEITSLEPAFTGGRAPTLTVRGYDRRHRLARGEKTRTFTQTTDSAIAQRVALAAGLTAQVTETRANLDYVLQNNQTDLEFLRKRAALIGYEVYVRDRMLYFQPPQHGQAAALTLTIGDDLREFAPRLRTLGQVDEVTVRGWDVARKQAVVAVATDASTMGDRSGPHRAGQAFGKAAANIVASSAPSSERADQMARGQYDDRALAFIEGEAECAGGRPLLRAGTVVAIAGAGTTFSGPYYVTSVTHTLNRGQGYRTRFEVRRNAA